MGLMDFFKKGKEKPVAQSTGTTSRPPMPQAPRPTVSQQAKPASSEYTIKSGDSLSKIAKQFYGNANEWQKIYNANRDKIKDPNLIYPGQKIIIP